MFTRPLLATAAALTLAVAPLTACSGTDGSGGTASDMAARKVSVVASLYPLAWLSQQVGGDRVDAVNLVPPGEEPHDLDLKPQQMTQMAKADLVVYEKGMASKVDDAITTAPAKRSLDVTTAVQMHKLAADAVEEGEDKNSNDPHVWLDPVDMQQMAAAIAAQLEQLDPTHKSTYESNLAAVNQKLHTLDTSYSTGLAHCQRQVFITSHAAFGYLANRYHLTQVAISGLSPDEEPSPARIAQIQALAKAKGVTTIFTETLVSPATAKAIAGDLHLRTAVLDPIEGITDQSAGTDYPSVMESNLTALKTANGCS